MRSWREIAKNEFRQYVRSSTLSDERKTALRQINIRGAWWSKTGQLTETLSVSQDDLRLARQIIRRVIAHDCRFPRLTRTRTMLMDGPVAQVEAGENTMDYWVRISTLDRGRVVRIPLQAHDYFDADPGAISNYCQVNVRDDRRPHFTLVKRKPVVDQRKDGDCLGLDWGLVNLFTTSDGQQLGRQLYPWLLRVDAQLTELTRQLQRNGIKPRDSKRYRRLQARIRAYARNEIGRVLNNIAEKDISEIAVEDLDFRGKGLSRQLRRIITRAGRAAIKAKLSSLQETKGIRIVTGNPAHTSRQCSGCGYTHPSNRRSQARFQCGFCGKKLHADVNAARVHVLRRSQNEEFAFYSRGQVQAALDRAFEARWGITAAEVSLRRRKRRCSTATGARIARSTSP